MSIVVVAAVAVVTVRAVYVGYSVCIADITNGGVHGAVVDETVLNT